MDATTTPSTISIVARLTKDFPDLRFAPGDTFRWSPKDETIYYLKTADPALLLHEVAHAILHHTDYTRDIDLLKMERDAWKLASATLSNKYGVAIAPEFKDDMLDTYRNWLHKRSTCPDCQATGVQTAANLYHCLACKASWRVNEARSCALRRYSLK